MPDSKITALTSISTSTDPANDPLVIVDVSDTSMAATGTTKKVTLNQLLGAGGTATLASATISGALAANADTTLGTASKATNTNLNFSSDLGTQRIYLDRGTRSLVFQDVTSSIENYRIAGITGVHTWGVGGSTAMTLNSTGLGVGVTPITQARLSLKSSAASPLNLVLQNRDASQNWQFYVDGVVVGDGILTINNGTSSVMQVTPSGNVGIGVTPSAWVSYQKAIDFGGAGNYGSVSARTDFSSFATNCYFNGTSWIYKNTYPAYSYEHTGGLHKWNTAPSGTAGNAITFTQAMTLDASGNLLVGTTSLGARSTNIFSKSGGFGLEVQQRASGSAGSCLGLTYSVGTPNNATDYFLYCADATTVRAYVVSNGNMLNVNGSYGTISDLRLKENISDARNYLADLLKLRVVKYSLKSEASPTANLIGLIAQEVEQVFPTLVETNADDVKSIKTTVLIPMLLKALQELTARVQTLETR